MILKRTVVIRLWCDKWSLLDTVTRRTSFEIVIPVLNYFNLCLKSFQSIFLRHQFFAIPLFCSYIFSGRTNSGWTWCSMQHRIFPCAHGFFKPNTFLIVKCYAISIPLSLNIEQFYLLTLSNKFPNGFLIHFFRKTFLNSRYNINQRNSTSSSKLYQNNMKLRKKSGSHPILDIYIRAKLGTLNCI